MSSSLLVASLVLGQALAQTAPPIANGDLEDGFPSAVGLGVPWGDSAIHICTGTLITPRIVLSAGHCSDDYPIESVIQIGKVFVGPDESDAEAVLALEDGGMHPDYFIDYGPSGVELEYDFAVLVLAEEAPMRPSFLHLDDIERDDVAEQDFLAVGYGITNSVSGAGSGRKRSGWLLGERLREHAIELVPGDENSMICSGDSGGPLFREVETEDGETEWVQWGIHSWGDENCRSLAGVQRLDVGAEWILDWVEDVHGTRDLCEAGGWHEDGVCNDSFCPDDPDCFVALDTGGGAGGGGDEGCGGCGVAGAPAAATVWLGLLGAVVRRRRG